MSLILQSTKTYTHAEGLSCVFRQWKAKSHCNKLHGYAIQVKLVFEQDFDASLTEDGGLSPEGWVMDFGGLKDIKQFLKDTFDHKTLIAADDPAYDSFVVLDANNVIDMVTLRSVGCEAFAEYIYSQINDALLPEEARDRNVLLKSVEVSEHAGNSAVIYRRVP